MYVVDDDEKDEPDGDEKDETSEEDEVEFKDLRTMYDDQAKGFEDLKTRFENLEKEKNQIAYQLRTSKKEPKPAEDAEEKFTDAQLIGLLDEHEDDKAAQLQIMKLVARQAHGDTEKKALDAVEISQTKKDLDKFIDTTYPDWKDSSSPILAGVEDMKSKLGFEDHPYGDWIGMASFILANIEHVEKAAQERGKNEALGIKADDNRKKDIKNKNLSPATKKTGESKVLSSRVVKVAKQIGLNKRQTKIYQNLLGKKSA
jgi:hypothetical protein